MRKPRGRQRGKSYTISCTISCPAAGLEAIRGGGEGGEEGLAVVRRVRADGGPVVGKAQAAGA